MDQGKRRWVERGGSSQQEPGWDEAGHLARRRSQAQFRYRDY